MWERARRVTPLPTPRRIMIPPAAEARTTDPIFAAIKAHQAAWELAREASDDDIDALMDDVS